MKDSKERVKQLEMEIEEEAKHRIKCETSYNRDRHERRGRRDGDDRGWRGADGYMSSKSSFPFFFFFLAFN